MLRAALRPFGSPPPPDEKLGCPTFGSQVGRLFSALLSALLSRCTVQYNFCPEHSGDIMGKPQHPQVGEHLVVDFPAPKVLLLRLNRPQALNAMTADLEADLTKVSHVSQVS